MNFTLRFVYLLTLLTTGLVAGVFFSEWLGLVPILHTQNAGDYIRLKQALIQAYNPAMPILGIGGSLFYIAWLVMVRRRGAFLTFRYGLIGFFLLAVSTAVTVAGEIPANHKILILSASTPGDTWSGLRDAANTTIAMRTALMLIAFVFLIVASSYSVQEERNQGKMSENRQ